jgi:hypothetical protein
MGTLPIKRISLYNLAILTLYLIINLKAPTRIPLYLEKYPDLISKQKSLNLVQITII